MRSLALGLFCLLCCDAARVRGRDRRQLTVPSAVQTNSVEMPCKGTPLDFVFIIDSSRSVRPADYEKVKLFIVHLLPFLDIGLHSTHVGLLQYGSVVQNEFSLRTYSSNAEVERAVRNMEHLATGTMTGLAIQYTMDVAFSEAEGARPVEANIPRIAMIVTDGRPQDTVEEVSAQARQAGIQIFAIGVGRVDMSTLRAIGSEPHSEHVFLVANFSQIETLTSVFQSTLCGGKEMCFEVDHQCEHLCVSTPASYMCRCRKGFTLNPDGKTCQGEDMCAVVDHGCAHVCANLPGAYECRCRAGYELNMDLKTCRRIDFCDLGDHGCQHDCMSTPESYTCRCKTGYVLNLDGKTCSHIDHCALGSHGCEHECVNTEDSFVCECHSGYTLNPDGKTCRKSDICSLGSHGCEHVCVNTEDSFVCECHSGYTLNPDGKTCRKSDICSLGSHGCEHVCVNTEDSFVCECHSGYTLNPDGKTCRKSDICSLGSHGCEHVCVNTEDSFVCECHSGYTLNPDGKTCRKSDICSLGSHGCEHVCVNTEDSFVCECHSRYTLNPDGKTCRKGDVCALGYHGCEHECVNTEDSFVCTCQIGYTLNPDGKTCKSLDLCKRVLHGCEHQCISTIDSYICKCFEGYTLAEDGKSCKKPECGDGVMDLVFVIDGSKSLGTANFELVKTFVNGIVDSLDVSRKGTHVGLLQYSTKVQTEFTLGKFTTSQDIKKAVTAMKYMGRGSMTGSALRHMFEKSFSAKEGARSNTPRVSIVFTDGRSQDDVSKWAAKAKEAGITLYALGVGKAIEEELREIASEPDSKHVYYAEDFSHMGEITDKLKSRICKEQPTGEEMCRCENVLLFQRQVNEQLMKLTQNNVVTKRLETLENSLGHK